MHSNIDLIREKLERYSIAKTGSDASDVTFLMGNTEMGGRLDRDGLGFSQMWFSDLWESAEIRMPLEGFSVSPVGRRIKNPGGYSQTLRCTDGMSLTSIDAGGLSYESEVFFSMSSRRLLVLQLRPGQSGRWRLHLPHPPEERNLSLSVYQPTGHTVYAASPQEAFSRFMYIVHSSAPLTRCAEREYEVDLDSEAPLTLLFSMHTHWSGEDFPSRCEDSIAASQDFHLLKAANQKHWDKLWENNAAIDIPDRELEQLFYRSLFWTFSTCGSDKFLPGESQFSSPAWQMIPYTYGGAGWSVFMYSAMGQPELAHKIAREHFKPSALRLNSRKYIDLITTGDEDAFFDPPASPTVERPSNPDRTYQTYITGKFTNHESLSDSAPLSFGHQVGLHGDCRIRRAHQRGIDAFAGGMFHRLTEHFEDEAFMNQYTYPVLKGTAEFWRSIAEWDAETASYALPRLHSVSENLSEVSLLDSVLAARGSLAMAARYAERLGIDSDLAEKWRYLSSNLPVAQNEHRYLEFLNDPGTREGGGYFGIRAPIFLGFPWPEMLHTLDSTLCLNTLVDGWKRNGGGAEMIGFIASWYALSFAALKDGESALECLSHNLKCLDESGTSLNESPAAPKPHFATNYTSFVLALSNMLVHSYDDIIHVLPALPGQWHDVTFHDICASANIRVSGSVKSGKVEWIRFTERGREIHRASQAGAYRIIRQGDGVSVQPRSGSSHPNARASKQS